MSRFVSMTNNTSCHTANNGAACSACFSSVMMIIAGIAMAMSVLFISGLALAVLCLCIIGLIIILRLSGAKGNRPKAMSMS